MRIGINTLSIMPGQIGGGETYLVNLLKHLIAIGGHMYVLYVNRYNAGLFPDALCARKQVCPVSKRNRSARVLWEQLALPGAARRTKLDLLFSPGNMMPIFGVPCVSVVTIHDLSPMHWPQGSRYEAGLRRFLVKRSALAADGVITDSEHSRRTIVSQLGLEPHKVFVITPAASNEFKPADAAEMPSVSARGHTILSVGTTHNYKNFARLLEAFTLLRSRSRSPLLLVIAGMPGGVDAELRASIERAGLTESVQMPGRVARAELMRLYRTADLFVCPSLHEGFGLPVLEAMACGLPVVSSRAASLPEVGGEAVIYFDPLDVKEMAAKMELVLETTELRRELIERGVRRAQQFSWRRAAEETLTVFETVCAARRHRLGVLESATDVEKML